LLTCQIFLRVFPCTIIFLKANIFLFSSSQNSCSFWTAILFFATRRIWADIRRVIQPIRLQNSSYTVNDYIINIYIYIYIYETLFWALLVLPSYLKGSTIESVISEFIWKHKLVPTMILLHPVRNTIFTTFTFVSMRAPNSNPL
jgi:hypothetical protein